MGNINEEHKKLLDNRIRVIRESIYVFKAFSLNLFRKIEKTQKPCYTESLSRNATFSWEIYVLKNTHTMGKCSSKANLIMAY